MQRFLREMRVILSTQNAQNYMKREATRFRPTGFCVFCEFSVRKKPRPVGSAYSAVSA